ncbi:MAG: iron-containing alcohol dehydrogenase [Tolumonas sp.]|nr:iron-containing alcohol dehydrogenase [Tolumonas sp.]
MPLYEMRKFVAPEFIFGVNARHRVGFYARNMMARRVFVVSDPGVIAAGWVKDVIADLTEVGIESVIFQELTSNPKDHEVMAGAEIYARERCDVIVAVGGGSVIDCAKAIGIVHTNGGHILDFEGADQIDIPGPPLICIPTTAGTAADISQFCIIVNSPERYKMAIISKCMVPDVALVDPETTLTMDTYLTACTGIDALTHAIEAYDLPSRENMLLGSLQAGLAFSNASLGAVHALAHALGGFLDLPHGECNALLLEHVVRFNISKATDRYKQIGEAIGLEMAGINERQRARRITEALNHLRNRLGIVNSLTQRGVRSADIPELAFHALNDACLVTNPRHAKIDDIKVIYGEAM